jgi:hypothetical protein
VNETVLVLIEVPEEHLQEVLQQLHKVDHMPDQIHLANAKLAGDIMELFWDERDNEEEE